MTTRISIPVVTDMSSAQNAVTEIKNYLTNLPNNMITGVGSPEGKVAAPVGWLYTDQKGSTGTTLYVKEANSNKKTGWVAQGVDNSPKEYLKKIQINSAISGNADTYVAVPDLVLTLTPGKWRIGFSVCPIMRNLAAATTATFGSVAMFKNGVLIAESVCGMYYTSLATGWLQAGNAYWDSIEDITESTTIQVYLRCGAAAANQLIGLYPSLTGSLTDPDAGNQIFAEQIKSYVESTPAPSQYAYVSPDIDFSSFVTYVSGGGSISSVNTARCVFFKTSNGAWWMEGILKLTATSTPRTSFIVNVAGVLPDGNGSTYWQGGYGDTNGSAIISYFQIYTTSGASRFHWAYASASCTHHTGSFKIRLSGKPTGYGLPDYV